MHTCCRKGQVNTQPVIRARRRAQAREENMITSESESPRTPIVDQLYDNVPTLKRTYFETRVRTWCIWWGICNPHEPPQAAVLFNTKGLPSGLDRTSGVVEHCRAPVQEEQPQRTPADEGPPGGRPLTSKPRRRRVSHLSQTGYKQGTGLGAGV